ncbi:MULTISPECIES: 4Fe-4S binding protein [Cereibacter]|uniref:4Fe-4S binding protein n=1 Tax=Cereibacter johrii TaxID=445629 RepID=A0ABX5JAU1_9RHOB|nr:MULTISPECIES: 4Fe-4S binding protein [Cereibacter]EKX59826.1 4Fe-4S ferredoxin, nitrogenase-associated [Rhodobacter sp. AKP1]QCP87567.1 ferredoxin [Cereibacter sphaeroides]RDS96817.1 ferredoxin [Cereibacter sphaeroides f. sp. denitrificans]ACM03225.1 4Fe-4S ferredoxin, iron-sulfur binding domain protein [Cereibacter sphaeroides KD131]MEA5160383.1 4Fe-4S binding protein [Cereibacter johrii]
MSMTISADLCTACGDCEPVCPTHAIVPRKGIYFIKSEVCTECEGEFDMPQCMSVCTSDSIAPLEA